MGMFDKLIYNGKEYQTKDTPAQSIATYEIRNNELWYKDTQYKWVEEPDNLFGGYLEEISHKWVPMTDFNGVINFYIYKQRKITEEPYEEEYHSLFVNGKVLKIERTK